MKALMMSRTSNAVSPLDGNFIRFEIRDGVRRISCAVSDEALEAVSGLTAPSTLLLRRRSFDRFRTLINVAAKLKVSTLPSGSIDLIVLTREDLRCVPSEAGVPSFGSSARDPTRRAASLIGDDAPVSSAPTSSDAASPQTREMMLGGKPMKGR
jgi:hypothetical protein